MPYIAAYTFLYYHKNIAGKSTPVQLVFFCFHKVRMFLKRLSKKCVKNFRIQPSLSQWVKKKLRFWDKKRRYKVWKSGKDGYFCTRNNAQVHLHTDRHSYLWEVLFLKGRTTVRIKNRFKKSKKRFGLEREKVLSLPTLAERLGSQIH